MTFHLLLIVYLIYNFRESYAYDFFDKNNINSNLSLSHVTIESANQVLPILNKPEFVSSTGEPTSMQTYLVNHREYGATPPPLIYQIGSTYHLSHFSQGNKLPSNLPHIFETNDLQDVFNDSLPWNDSIEFSKASKIENGQHNSPALKLNKSQQQRAVLSNIQEIIDILQHQKLFRPENNTRNVVKEKVISGVSNKQSQMALAPRWGTLQLTAPLPSLVPPRLLPMDRAVSIDGQSTWVDTRNVITTHRPDRLKLYSLLAGFNATHLKPHRHGPLGLPILTDQRAMTGTVVPSMVVGAKWSIPNVSTRSGALKPRWRIVNRTNEGDLDERKLMSHIHDVLMRFEQREPALGETQASSPLFNFHPSSLHLVEMDRMLASITPYGQRITKLPLEDIYTVAESSPQEHRNPRQHRSRHSHWTNNTDFMLIPPYMLDTAQLLSPNHSLGLDSLDWSDINHHLDSSKDQSKSNSTDKDYAHQLKSYFQNLTLSFPIETTDGDMSILTNDHGKQNWTVIQTEKDKEKWDQLLLKDIIQLAKTPIDYNPGKTQVIQYPRQKLVGSEKWRRLNSFNDSQLNWFDSLNHSTFMEKSNATPSNVIISSIVQSRTFNQSNHSLTKKIQLPKIPVDGMMAVDDFNTPLQPRPFHLDNIDHSVRPKSKFIPIGPVQKGRFSRKQFRPPSLFRQHRHRILHQRSRFL